MFKNPFKKDTPATPEQSFPVTLHLNARFQPNHRHELEDALEEILSAKALGEVTGGGTMQMASGEISSCDIELDLLGNQPETLAALTDILNKIGIARGSKIIWQTETGSNKEIPVGTLEGLALYLNGTDLPEEVYATCNINEVIQQLETRLEKIGSLYSWWEGPENTALYFYGTSYSKMLAAIEPFLQEHPLCQKSTVKQIA